MLSKAFFHSLGFRRFAADEAVVATFQSLVVYEARGIITEPDTTTVIDGSIDGAHYRLAACHSVNQGCTALVGDTFVDDEDAWKKTIGSSGPFLLVQFGPTNAHSASEGWIKSEPDGSLTTHNSFPDARADLSRLEDAALPRISTALTCALSGGSRFLAIRKLARTSAGQTADGKVLHDQRIEASGSGYASYPLALDEIAIKLEHAVALASKLNPKGARFFALGTSETDELKRFLYFFLALEVETEATFHRIYHASSTTQALAFEAPVLQATTHLPQQQVTQPRHLHDRFVWCAASVWTHLTDDDVALFKRLKKARNDIAHGSASEPPADFARQTELLARKIFSARGLASKHCP